jgi:hypothetical protein
MNTPRRQVDAPPDESPAASWFIVQRRQQVHAEMTANILRMAAIVLFYLAQLAGHTGLDLGFARLPAASDAASHRSMTAIAVAWMSLAVGVHLGLTLHVRPQILTYSSILVDLVLLALLLCLGSGPRDPLVAGFFLIIAMATLRFSERVVAAATVEALIGYAAVLLYAGRVADARNLQVPRYQQALTLASIALAGLILWQAVIRGRIVAADFARRRLDVATEPEGRDQ